MGLETWDAHANVLPRGRNVYWPDQPARTPLKMSYGMDIGLQCYLGVDVLPRPQFICQTRAGWSSWEVRMPKTAMDPSPLCHGACAFLSAGVWQGPGEMALEKWPQCMTGSGCYSRPWRRIMNNRPTCQP